MTEVYKWIHWPMLFALVLIAAFTSAASAQEVAVAAEGAELISMLAHIPGAGLGLAVGVLMARNRGASHDIRSRLDRIEDKLEALRNGIDRMDDYGGRIAVLESRVAS